MKLIPECLIARKQEFLDKVKPDENGCWVWQGKLSVGYGTLKGILAHRLSHAIYKGDPHGFFVLHSCDNPPCVNPAHLRLGTAKDNSKDASLRKRFKQKKGSDNHAAKLNHKQVKQLVDFYLSDKSISVSEAGRKFNISPCAAANYLRLSNVAIRPPFRVSPELEKRILELYDKDKTNMRLLAKELNIGVKGIVNVLKRNNIDRKSYQIKSGHKNEMRWRNRTAKPVDV